MCALQIKKCVCEVQGGLIRCEKVVVDTNSSLCKTHHCLQDAATATAAAAASASSLPLLPGLLPSNAVTDALSYLHAHPQLRSALITFLEADSTKEFLATVTQLAIKINPKQFAALVSHLIAYW